MGQAVEHAAGVLTRLTRGDSRAADELAPTLYEQLGGPGGVDEREARPVEPRFLCGLGEAGAATLVGVSRATASREWLMARSWLVREPERMEG